MIEIGPYQNRQRRTCLVVGNSKTSVDVIMLETVSGLRVTQMTETAFNKEFKPINGYPLHKAIEQYIEFAIYCGMSNDVREIFTNMLEGIGKKGTDVSLALAKLNQVPASKAKEEPVKKSRTKKQSSNDDDDLPWYDDQPSSDKAEKKVAKAVSGKAPKDLSEKRGKTTPPEKPTKEDKKAMPAKRTTKVPQRA